MPSKAKKGEAEGSRAPRRAKSPATRTRRRHRGRYSEQERRRILAAAEQGGLSAARVYERFGVTPVTFYAWRKKARPNGRRRRSTREAGDAALAGALRREIQAQIARVVPQVVRREFASMLSGGRRGGGRS